MIAGIGIDLVNCARMVRLHEGWGNRLERRLLAAAEIQDLPLAPASRCRRLAFAFAAKEALAKALGTGMRWPASWHQIRVARDGLGAPGFAFGSSLQARLAELGIAKVHLSLSDDAGMVVAVAVLERQA